MMFFFVPNSYPDCEYDYDIRYWNFEDSGVVFAVTFVPLEECDERTVNQFVSMAAESIEVSAEFGARIFLPTNLDNLEEFIEHKELAITFFLLFNNMQEIEQYITKMEAKEIF